MLRQFVFAFLALQVSTQALGSISLSATRVVFDGAHKEANITVRNGNQDALIQSWIDREDTSDKATPFAVTPPLARVFAKEQQLLRILYEGQGMPTDKESVVWLNVQEIPQASKTANTLQLAVRQRIKVFFRPVGLPGDPILAPTQLQWQVTQENGNAVLIVKNPGAYHVSMTDLALRDSKGSEVALDSKMVGPGTEARFSLSRFSSASPPVRLTFSTINDYGAMSHYQASLINGQAVNAEPTESK
ncbi:molecular chaperone [Pseudomonas fluorescens]|uniref:Pilus assembly protein n=1 Tax=Pseudomonas fluorescens TaxID=294 RepID=A0A423LLW0_PSEFL|nr:molecular chaperone [Pseudomonas fluorescens]RON69332.1 pilus assembly protein [Pseudomonas fluorescens]